MNHSITNTFGKEKMNEMWITFQERLKFSIMLIEILKNFVWKYKHLIWMHVY